MKRRNATWVDSWADLPYYDRIQAKRARLLRERQDEGLRYFVVAFFTAPAIYLFTRVVTLLAS